MNRLENNFENITIKGRYVYGYICLKMYMNNFLNNETPKFLDENIKLFTSIQDLSKWHEIVEEILPSFILKHYFSENIYEFISYIEYDLLMKYYSKNSIDLNDLIENLFGIGYSNLYGGYNSNYSKAYLDDIIQILNKNNIDLPDINLINNFKIIDNKYWGGFYDMNNLNI